MSQLLHSGIERKPLRLLVAHFLIFRSYSLFLGTFGTVVDWRRNQAGRDRFFRIVVRTVQDHFTKSWCMYSSWLLYSFWAPVSLQNWTCTRLLPSIVFYRFQQMSEEMTDVVFLKVDVDACETIAEKYNISSMPTFHFVKEKKKVQYLFRVVLSLLYSWLHDNAGLYCILCIAVVWNFKYSHEPQVDLLEYRNSTMKVS